MDKIVYHPLFSMRGKILCLVSITTLMTALILGGYFVHQASKNVLRIVNDELVAQGNLITPIAQAAYSELGNDAFVISKTPPIQGLIRSIRNEGVDLLDASTTQLWTDRLQTIFTSIMNAKPSYLQIRYIGVEDGGRELVRVDRSNKGIVSTAPEQLQQKGGETYFKEALSLQAGDIYYSEVTLNREHGKVEIPFRPVIRVIVPVFDTNNQLFGMIVINATYQELLKHALKELNTNKELYIIAESGDFIHYSYDNAEENKFKYVSSVENPKSRPVIQAILKSDSDKETIYEVINDKNIVLHVNKQYYNPSNRKQFFTTAVLASEETFLAPVYTTQRNAIILIIALMIVTSFFAIYFSYRLTGPLKGMTDEIRDLRDDLNITSLPTHLRDEIGELARAFQDLADRAKHANAELYRTSHDLRSPLMSSIGLLDMVKTNLREGDHDDAIESLGYIDKSLKKVEMLVYDVLQLTKARNEQEEKVEIDLKALINNALKKTQHMDGFDRLKVKKDLRFDGILMAQEGRMISIVENLISNAVKYQDKEKDQSFIKITTYTNENNLVMEFLDNGIGIPEDQQENLFVMFKRFHPRISFGSGLGLYIIRKSADVLNGEISFESPKEGGSMFRLKVPL